jgi:hypothetical protein
MSRYNTTTREHRDPNIPVPTLFSFKRKKSQFARYLN